ncbi:hypothetical protein LRH25_21175 [Ideonella azotifigens]|uniref:Uncharacterized protein n=1 Tax=Ideonella azotifigens TaxID=513160 RepID=A0ABP3VL00_9BURK|nr:hypothetical protein [Ideonella azotifigens]MCD2342846.1 hypothetical protein [Ideonella azotifigens]
MLESEKLAIAAHLHVVMRRKMGRVTDVEWLVRSPEYAREIIRVALAEVAHPELVEWGQRFLAAMFPPPAEARPLPARAVAERHTPSGFGESRFGRSASAPTAPSAPPPARYVGSLR